MLYIGIDLGTSAVKLLLMNEAGQILNGGSQAGLEPAEPGGLAQGGVGGNSGPAGGL